MVITLWVCQFTAFGLMAVGFGLAGLWPGLLVVTLLNFFNLVGHRMKWPWLPTVVLFFHVGIAVVGLRLGVTPWLLIPGVVAALGCWELNDGGNLRHSASEVPAEHESRQNQLNLLSISMAISLLVTGMGLYLKFHPGFGVTYAAAVIVAFSLFQVYRLIKYHITST